MITLRIYPLIKKLLRNTLRINIEIDTEDDASRYLWLVAWRLNQKVTKDYILFALENIIKGIPITEYRVIDLRNSIKNHPELEKEVNLDNKYVIIDRSVFDALRHESQP